MKYKWDKKYLYWGITAFVVIIAVKLADALFISAVSETVGIGDFFKNVINALSPVFYGFAIAYLLNPVENFFEKSVYMHLAMKKKAKTNPEHDYGNGVIIRSKNRARIFGVACAMFTMFVVVAGVIIIVIPQLISTISGLIENLPGYINGLTDWANEQLADYPDVQEWFTETIDGIYDALKEWINDSLIPQMSNIVVTFSNGIMAVIQVFSNLFFGIVIAVYFLYGKELFAAQLKKLLYSFSSARYANAIMRNMRVINRAFGGFLSGKLIDSLIIMLIFMILFSVLRFPYSALCAVILGVFNIIPVFGPIIGAVPCVLLMLLEDPIYAVYLVVIIIIVQQIDGNVLGPKILGGSTGLSSFWIIFALLVGQGIFGFIGLIIGIPLFAVIYSILRTRVGIRLEKKGLPSDSNVYRKVGYVDEKTGELITLYEMNRSEQIREEQKNLEKQTKHGHLRRHFRKLKQRSRKK